MMNHQHALVDALVARGHAVRMFDNLEPQVHGPLAEQGRWPAYANPGAEYLLGDVRDVHALSRALAGVEVVYHLAAATGVGQSMHQIAKYVEVNVGGDGRPAGRAGQRLALGALGAQARAGLLARGLWRGRVPLRGVRHRDARFRARVRCRGRAHRGCGAGPAGRRHLQHRINDPGQRAVAGRP